MQHTICNYCELQLYLGSSKGLCYTGCRLNIALEFVDGFAKLVLKTEGSHKFIWYKLVPVGDYEAISHELQETKSKLAILQEVCDRPENIGSKLNYNDIKNALE